MLPFVFLLVGTQVSLVVACNNQVRIPHSEIDKLACQAESAGITKRSGVTLFRPSANVALDHFGSEKCFSEPFSLPTAMQILRADRLGQPSVRYAVFIFFFSAIILASASSHSSLALTHPSFRAWSRLYRRFLGRFSPPLALSTSVPIFLGREIRRSKDLKIIVFIFVDFLQLQG